MTSIVSAPKLAMRMRSAAFGASAARVAAVRVCMYYTV
jgi:hypothetical protein